MYIFMLCVCQGMDWNGSDVEQGTGFRELVYERGKGKYHRGKYSMSVAGGVLSERSECVLMVEVFLQQAYKKKE